ncbi:Sodium:neurotransmitter symporter family [Popillia japonica]|uniref:Sodium:neurotransmitter symporter family n=1 Tax=Popillia japonica TaxID=7064 RepID=A0AAW1IYT5_POPJA
MACRNTEKEEEAAKDIIDSCTDNANVGKLAVEELDLNSLKSVKGFATKFSKSMRELIFYSTMLEFLLVHTEILKTALNPNLVPII